RSEAWGDGLRRPRPIERESGSDPRTRSGGDRRPEAARAGTQTNPEKTAGAEFFFLCEGQGSLEWVRPEIGARALESAAVPAASGELSLALENPGEKVKVSRRAVPISAAGLQGEQPLAC